MGKPNPQQKKQIYIFIISLILLPFLVVGVKLAVDYRSKASTSAQPQQVVMSNISANSAVVSFNTDEAVTATATAKKDTANLLGRDTRDEKTEGQYKIHYLVFSNLVPESNYTVTILSGGQSFTDASWTFKTAPIAEQIGVPSPLKGKIASAANLPEALVYAIMGDASGNSQVVSTLINNNQTFVIDRNNFIDAQGKVMDPTSKDVILYIDALIQGKAKQQFGADKEPEGTIALAQSPMSFSATEKITPGGTINPNPISPSPGTSPTPTNDNSTVVKANDFSEKLLLTPFSSGAELENPEVPYNIFVSNLGPTGFTINWLTKQPTIGFLEVQEGENVTPLYDSRDGTVTNAKERYTHYVEARSNNLTVGSIVKFKINSNSIRYGQNIAEVAQDIQTQHTTYITTPSRAPTFSYAPTTTLTIIPLEVAIPKTPSSPPLPVVVQGNISAAITPESYQTSLKAVAAKSGELQISKIDVERDFLVATRTTDGLWVSAYPNSSLGYSLSLGSAFLQTKKKYSQIETGQSIQMMAYGFLNQQLNKSITYNDEAVAVSLENPFALISIPNNAQLNKPYLIGFAAPNSTIEFQLNNQSETTQAKADGSWQLLAKHLQPGFNQLSFSDGTTANKQTLAFELGLAELPITATPEQNLSIILGVIFLTSGLVIWRKFARRAGTNAK